MPTLDLSFVTMMPEIAGERFRVRRRRETVDSHGRSVTSEMVYDDVIGGIYPVGPNALVRDPERDYGTKTIQINTRFRLQLTSPGYKPDLVEWPVGSGTTFVITSVEDYSSYGSGFVSAQAALIDAQAAPPAAAV